MKVVHLRARNRVRSPYERNPYRLISRMEIDAIPPWRVKFSDCDEGGGGLQCKVERQSVDTKLWDLRRGFIYARNDALRSAQFTRPAKDETRVLTTNRATPEIDRGSQTPRAVTEACDEVGAPLTDKPSDGDKDTGTVEAATTFDFDRDPQTAPTVVNATEVGSPLCTMSSDDSVDTRNVEATTSESDSQTVPAVEGAIHDGAPLSAGSSDSDRDTRTVLVTTTEVGYPSVLPHAGDASSLAKVSQIASPECVYDGISRSPIARVSVQDAATFPGEEQLKSRGGASQTCNEDYRVSAQRNVYSPIGHSQAHAPSAISTSMPAECSGIMLPAPGSNPSPTVAHTAISTTRASEDTRRQSLDGVGGSAPHEGERLASTPSWTRNRSASPRGVDMSESRDVRPNTQRIAQDQGATISSRHKLRKYGVEMNCFRSIGASTLSTPHVTGRTMPGDVYLHLGAGTAQLWYKDLHGVWAAAQTGMDHPEYSDYCLNISSDLWGRWVLKKTVSTYKGREKARYGSATSLH